MTDPSRRPTRFPGWFDAVVNLLVAPLLVSGLAFHDLAYNSAGPVSWILGLATIWPLVARRRAPLLVFAICLLGLFGLYATSSPPFAGVALLPALYTVAAHRPARTSLIAAVALELLVVLEAVQQAPAGSIDDTIVVLSASAIAALLLGTTIRTQRRLVASLEDRASRAEHEREQEAAMAATAERTKIAREMHDIVAHGLSVVITLSEGAVARLDEDPTTAKRTMEQVASTGRQSLGEMRRLLGVLRDDDVASRAPQPGIADLQELLADVRSTGLTVEFESDPALLRLDPTMQAALYRAVQEALTNVLKHARGAQRASVRLEQVGDVVRFMVHDDGSPRARKEPPGNGLIGMAERAAIFGGSVRTSAGPDGWTVRGELEAVSAAHGVGADR